MPKIGTIKLKYEGEFYTQHEIHYKHKEGFWIKGLSEEFVALTGFRPNSHPTEAGLIDQAQTACCLYRELKTKTSLVILYKCYASPLLTMNKQKEGQYVGILDGVSHKISRTPFGSPAATFGVDFKIAACVNDGVTKIYFRVDQETLTATTWKINDAHSFQEISYTTERYNFFLNLVEGMKKMVLSASKFFGSDSKEAELFIDNNKTKLLGN